MNFYQNLVGKRLRTNREVVIIQCAWFDENRNKVFVMYSNTYGNLFKLELPDPDFYLDLENDPIANIKQAKENLQKAEDQFLISRGYKKSAGGNYWITPETKDKDVENQHHMDHSYAMKIEMNK